MMTVLWIVIGAGALVLALGVLLLVWQHFIQ